MAIYEITDDTLVEIKETTFSDVNIKERQDLQRLLREKIDVISPDLLVLSEEFGEWDESRRRIDLLCLDKDANLVVIELKRTEDGGHMELQALRYAAMVSTMTFEKATEVYASFLSEKESDLNAAESILEFLEWGEPDEDSFAQDVRIILVSANFSKELTTAVMWLNERNLDIQCVRFKPYKDNERVLIDVQQIIPLPEAEEYTIQIREKAGKERTDRKGKENRLALRYKFWESLLMRAKEKTPLHSNISPSQDGWIACGSGVSGIHYFYAVRKHDTYVQLILEGEKEKNKANFDFLQDYKDDIQSAFGGKLEWRRCDLLKKSQIGINFTLGGYRNDESEWPKIQDAMIDAMIRLEKAFSPYIPKL